MDACILIKTVPIKSEDILREVKKIKEVRRAFIASGRWDIVAFLEAPDYKRLTKIIGKINSLEGIRSTETLAGI